MKDTRLLAHSFFIGRWQQQLPSSVVYELIVVFGVSREGN